MTIFIESLKRLYMMEKVNVEKLETLKGNNKITQEEYDYITLKQNIL